MRIPYNQQQHFLLRNYLCKMISGIYKDTHPCDAELFASIFYSFEAGIANAISSFK